MKLHKLSSRPKVNGTSKKRDYLGTVLPVIYQKRGKKVKDKIPNSLEFQLPVQKRASLCDK